MPATRRRRLVRWTLIAVVGPLLFVASYVTSWLLISMAASQGTISPRVAEVTRIAFVPLILYCSSDLPGAKLLSHTWWQWIAKVPGPEPIFKLGETSPLFAPQREPISPRDPYSPDDWW